MDTPINKSSAVLSRRGFLVAAAGTGVAFSFLTACTTGETASTAPAYEPTQWYSIDNNGIVTVNVIRAAMSLKRRGRMCGSIMWILIRSGA